MYYSDELVRDVIAANDIVDVVSRYVTLKRSGRGFVGLCPFHHEKTPSFHVSPDKQLYHCFGCGEGGSAVNFIMKAENLDFVEALKQLADNARIALPEPDQSGDRDEFYRRKQRTCQANTLAARFYYNYLVSEAAAKDALLYFMNRGFTRKTITAFGLGYAPAGRTALIEYMKTQGFEPDELALCGLAIIKDNKFIDKFRNRVMFPIIDVRGNVIGFGGRVMDDSIPKYLNSPETPAFNKSRNLFALNFAKNKQEEALILVEGYMDVISLHQVGITNVVATLGTALTEEQAKLICRYAKEVILCYDSDEAGVKATLRAIDILSAAGARVRVLSLPGVKDPDEYIGKHSAESFRTLSGKSPPSTQFRLNLLKTQYDLNNIDEKIRFVGEAAKVLAGLSSMVEADAYVNELAHTCDIKKESIYAEVKKIQSRQARYSRSGPGAVQAPSRTVDNSTAGPVQTELSQLRTSRLSGAERLLLSLIYRSKPAAKKAQAKLGEHSFSEPLHQQLAALCLRAWDADTPPDAVAITAHFAAQDAAYISGILCDRAVYEDETAAAEDLILTIQQELLKKQIKSETDPVRLQALLSEQAGLKRGGTPI